MDFNDFTRYLDKINCLYEKEAKTSPLVSFKIGGIAKLIVFPENIPIFCKILEVIISNNIKYFVLCNGTNTYFNEYYDGVVISVKKINIVRVENNKIIAECGASLNICAEFAKKHGLSGLEFAFGIPGGIGGGLYMNASAFGGSISDIVKYSNVFDTKTLKIKRIDTKEHLFDSKSSIFQSGRYILLSTEMCLSNGKKIDIEKKMHDYLCRRIKTQPLDLPSAGSVFKRPKNNYASKLIDEAGLKGFTVGGASVSNKHAGFIVNNGGATADDVNEVIKHIKHIILEKYNVKLENEIIYVEWEMGTFSSSVRREIVDAEARHKLCCAFSFLYGACCFLKNKNSEYITFSTNVENVKMIKNICEIIDNKKHFNYSINKRQISIKSDFILYSTIVEIEKKVFKCQHCKEYFLKGLFLTYGTINDPEKSYRLELVFNKETDVKQIINFLNEIGISPKQVERNQKHVIYFKDSEMISDFLAYAGANNSAFTIMNSKIMKELRNDVNRVTNCDSANINKMVNASRKYCEAINGLIELDLFDELPDTLKEMAQKRLEFNNLNYLDLGKKFNPPISKSGVYHRLEKILEFYEKNKV